MKTRNENLRNLQRTSKLEIEVFSDKKQKCMVKYSKEGILTVEDEDGNEMPIKNSKIVRMRERASLLNKGEKTLTAIDTTDIVSLNMNNYVTAFDAVYAVDTNSRQINNIWYSRGVIVKLNKFEMNCDGTYEAWVEDFRYIESENLVQKPQMEQAVWNKAITLIQKVEPIHNKVALIVDCDLGKIELYNRHELKIRDDIFLPDNFKLVYASADNNDNIFNKLIKCCDSRATELLNQIGNSGEIV